MQPRTFSTKGPLDPVKDKDTLIERRELWQIVRLATQASVYGYAAVLSPRQTGKTTLLYHARSILSQQDCGVAYVDLSPLENRDEESCYEFVCKQILADLEGQLRLSRAAREQLEEVTNPIAFRAFLKEVAERARPSRLVIMLDEVKAIPASISSAFFGTIRSVFTSRRKESEQIFEKYVFVLAGANELYDLTSGENSPLNICEKIYLHDLEAGDVWKLVSGLQRTGCRISRKASDYLYAQTRGHPYLTQRICSILELRQAPALTVPAIDEAIAEILRGDDNLEHVTRQLSRDAKARAVAHKLVAGEHEVPFSRVNPTISRLEMIGVVADGASCSVRNPIYEAALRSYFDVAGRGGGAGAKVRRALLTAILVLLLLATLPTIYLYLTEVVFADRFENQSIELAALEATAFVRHDALLRTNHDQEIEVELRRDAASIAPGALLVDLMPIERDITIPDGVFVLIYTDVHQSQRFSIRLQKSVRLQDILFPFLMERDRHIDLFVERAQSGGAASTPSPRTPFYTAVLKIDYFSSFIGSVVVWLVSLLAGLGSILSHLDSLGGWRRNLARILDSNRQES